MNSKLLFNGFGLILNGFGRKHLDAHAVGPKTGNDERQCRTSFQIEVRIRGSHS